MRLGTAPPLRARLLAPQIYRREPDPKARGDHRRRQTGRISQQHPLAQISRIGAWHHCLLQETNHSTHKQHAFQIHTESALIQPLHGITFALLHLACMRRLAEAVPPRLSATALTLYGTVAIGAVSALLTLISGWLYGAAGPAGFWMMAALCATALPFARRL